MGACIRRTGLISILIVCLGVVVQLCYPHYVAFGFFSIIMTMVKRGANGADDRQTGESAENWAMRRILDQAPPPKLFKDVAEGRKMVDAMGVFSPHHTILRPLPTHIFTIPNTVLKGSGPTDITIRHVQPNKVISSKKVILYVHGGAYCAGSWEAEGGFATEIAHRTSTDLYFVDYRRAPEVSHATIISEAAAAYQWLLTKYDADNIAFIGESAGGGIQALVLLMAKENKWPLPKVAWLSSMFSDVTFESSYSSWIRNAANDRMLGGCSKCVNVLPGNITWVFIFGDQQVWSIADFANPKISPLFGDWNGVTTQIFLDAGEYEVLVDQITAMSNRLTEHGVTHEYNIVKYGQHIPSFSSYWIPEANVALDDALEFVVRHLHGTIS